MTRLIAAALLTVCWTLPLPASAGPIFQVSTSTYASPGMEGCSGDADGGPGVYTSSSTSCGNSAFAYVSGTGGYGQLGASAAAAVTGDGPSSQATASISAFIDDFGVVAGPSATPLEFLVNFALTGTLQVTDCTPEPNAGTGTAQISSGLSINGTGGTLTMTACSPVAPSELTFTLVLLAGDPINYSQTLGATAVANFRNFNSTANALHTSLLNITALTPGASIAWNSGHDYSASVLPQPVPEPATLLLLGSGLVGIAAKARRRNKVQH